jgi:hypothetical protein
MKERATNLQSQTPAVCISGLCWLGLSWKHNTPERGKAGGIGTNRRRAQGSKCTNQYPATLTVREIGLEGVLWKSDKLDKPLAQRKDIGRDVVGQTKGTRRTAHKGSQ